MIIFFVDSIERFVFFRRLYDALKREENIVMYTCEPFVWLRCISLGIRCELLYKNMKKKVPRELEEESALSIEVLNREISEENARRDFFSIIDLMAIKLDIIKVRKVIIWNGQQLFCRAAAYFAKKNNLALVYLELSNLPNKLFRDLNGVNANSSLTKKISDLDCLSDVTVDYHEAWKISYRKYKEKPIPQERLKKKYLFFSLLNLLIKKIYPSLLNSGLSLRMARTKRFNVKVDKIPHDKFVFLPLQVSTDTQIKLHSTFDNIQAISRAKGLAESRNCDLVVKMHPAERNAGELKKVLAAKNSIGFFLTNENTNKLILNSEFVVTINSTVGLEAMIEGREVITLGSCFYKDFDQVRLRKYVHSFLIHGIDYFSKKPIKKIDAIKIING